MIMYSTSAFNIAEWRLTMPELEQISNIQVVLKPKLTRMYEYYIWNICFLLFSVCLLNILVFCCDVRANGERLGVNITLLLTAIAFKQLLTESLPRVAYLTILDKWMLICLFVLFLSTWTCVVPSFFEDDNIAASVNKWIGFFMFILSIGI